MGNKFTKSDFLFLFFRSYRAYGLHVLVVCLAKYMSARLVIRHKIKCVKVGLRV